MAERTLREWQAEVDRWAHAKGWREPRGRGDVLSLLMLMVSELSEAGEEFRNGRRPDEVYVHDDKPEGIPIELADVVIRIMEFAGYYGFDLQDAVATKMAFNWTRPHRHGGKVA